VTDLTPSARPERSAGQIFFRYWLPVAVLCGVIFVQSAYPLPGHILHWPNSDKLLHMGVYGVLGALICRALSTVGRLSAGKWPLLMCAVVLTTLYGLSDEWHQSFVPGRDASAADLLADFIGAIAGSSLGLVLVQRFRPFR
jgi:VanZ family protein